MNFPNPVARTDLPTQRRKLPRVLLGVAVLFILGLIFLPQILSSKVGRKFVVSYLASKTNSAVTLSWGAATAQDLAFDLGRLDRRAGTGREHRRRGRGEQGQRQRAGRRSSPHQPAAGAGAI